MSASTVVYNILKNAMDLSAAEPVTYSRVTIVIAEDDEGNRQEVTVGSDTGEELVINMPQCQNTDTAAAAAQNILNSLRGFKYQPFTAGSAILDPAAEAGDAVVINGLYSGVYNRSYSFGRFMASDLEAPQDQDIDHEYVFEDSADRQYRRDMAGMASRFRLTAEQISAEVTRASLAEGELSSRISQTAEEITANVVTKTGGAQQSFGWKLDATGFALMSGGRQVMNVGTDGTATFAGIVNAAAGGTIGGFDIGRNDIHQGTDSMSSTEAGVYVGTDGINVGGNLKATSYGEIYAANLRLTGSVLFDTGDGGYESMNSGTVKSLLNQVYYSGGGWSSGVNSYNNLISGASEVDWLKCHYFQCQGGNGGGSAFFGSSGAPQSRFQVDATNIALNAGTSFSLKCGGAAHTLAWKSARVITSVTVASYKVPAYDASGSYLGYRSPLHSAASATINYLGY